MLDRRMGVLLGAMRIRVLLNRFCDRYQPPMLAEQVFSFLFQNLKNSYQCSICFKTAHDETLRVDEKFVAPNGKSTLDFVTSPTTRSFSFR